MKQLYTNIINTVANKEKTIVQNGGRVYIGPVDVTEELIAIINQTAKVCVDYADCVNDDTTSEWDKGVRAAEQQIQTAFTL